MCQQEREKLYWDGQEVRFYGEPEIIRHPRISRSGSNAIRSTGCYRGYIGTWILQKNNLFLANIEGGYKVIGEDPIFADWITGIFHICEGYYGRRQKSGYLLEIENGVLKSKTYQVTPKPSSVEDLEFLDISDPPEYLRKPTIKA